MVSKLYRVNFDMIAERAREILEGGNGKQQKDVQRI